MKYGLRNVNKSGFPDINLCTYNGIVTRPIITYANIQNNMQASNNSDDTKAEVKDASVKTPTEKKSKGLSISKELVKPKTRPLITYANIQYNMQASNNSADTEAEVKDTLVYEEGSSISKKLVKPECVLKCHGGNVFRTLPSRKTDLERRKLWLHLLGKKNNFRGNMYVCEHHFDEEMRKRDKQKVYPNINLPVPLEESLPEEMEMLTECIQKCVDYRRKYIFPSLEDNAERRKTWLIIFGRDPDLYDYDIYACDRHFSDQMRVEHFLLPYAIPDQNVKTVQSVLQNYPLQKIKDLSKKSHTSTINQYHCNDSENSVLLDGCDTSNQKANILDALGMEILAPNNQTNNNSQATADSDVQFVKMHTLGVFIQSCKGYMESVDTVLAAEDPLDTEECKPYEWIEPVEPKLELTIQKIDKKDYENEDDENVDDVYDYVYDGYRRDGDEESNEFDKYERKEDVHDEDEECNEFDEYELIEDKYQTEDHGVNEVITSSDMQNLHTNYAVKRIIDYDPNANTQKRLKYTEPQLSNAKREKEYEDEDEDSLDWMDTAFATQSDTIDRDVNMAKPEEKVTTSAPQKVVNDFLENYLNTLKKKEDTTSLNSDNILIYRRAVQTPNNNNMTLTNKINNTITTTTQTTKTNANANKNVECIKQKAAENSTKNFIIANNALKTKNNNKTNDDHILEELAAKYPAEKLLITNIASSNVNRRENIINSLQNVLTHDEKLRNATTTPLTITNQPKLNEKSYLLQLENASSYRSSWQKVVNKVQKLQTNPNTNAKPPSALRATNQPLPKTNKIPRPLVHLVSKSSNNPCEQVVEIVKKMETNPRTDDDENNVDMLTDSVLKGTSWQEVRQIIEKHASNSGVKKAVEKILNDAETNAPKLTEMVVVKDSVTDSKVIRNDTPMKDTQKSQTALAALTKTKGVVNALKDPNSPVVLFKVGKKHILVNPNIEMERKNLEAKGKSSFKYEKLTPKTFQKATTNQLLIGSSGNVTDFKQQQQTESLENIEENQTQATNDDDTMQHQMEGLFDDEVKLEDVEPNEIILSDNMNGQQIKRILKENVDSEEGEMAQIEDHNYNETNQRLQKANDCLNENNTSITNSNASNESSHQTESAHNPIASKTSEQLLKQTPPTCVMKCQNFTHLFTFPGKSTLRRHFWFLQSKLDMKDNWDTTLYICNKHFDSNMLIGNGTDTTIHYYAYPCKELPQPLALPHSSIETQTIDQHNNADLLSELHELEDLDKEADSQIARLKLLIRLKQEAARLLAEMDNSEEVVDLEQS